MSRDRLPLLAAMMVLCMLSGCADYLNRYDSITLATGDAQRHNLMLHTVNPFNPASQNTKIESDGARAAEVVRRYRVPAAQSDQTQQNITVNVGAQN